MESVSWKLDMSLTPPLASTFLFGLGALPPGMVVFARIRNLGPDEVTVNWGPTPGGSRVPSGAELGGVLSTAGNVSIAFTVQPPSPTARANGVLEIERWAAS